MHAGDLKQTSAIDDPDTAQARTGYVISYAKCPLIWASKLQTEIALSSTEVEYIALSMAGKEVILELAKEAATFKIVDQVHTPDIRCEMFEDSQGAVEMANAPKMHPQTKDFNIKYHFFRKYVEDGTLQLLHIPGEDQMADVLTKPLEETTFQRHRYSISGW